MNTSIHLLPESDIEYLNLKEFKCELRVHGSDIHLIIDEFELPAAYTPRNCRLLLKLPAGYPNTNPDMFWTRPDIRLTSGEFPVAANVQETFVDGNWQRWSRHTNTWRSGVDNIQSKLRAVRTELDKGR
ncbi:MAG: E2/UBC family protein [Candidatus Acidiferrales bacterium]